MNNPLGIFSWFGFVLPFQERIALIKEAGFTATSLWWEDEDAPHPMKKERLIQLLRNVRSLHKNFWKRPIKVSRIVRLYYRDLK